MLQAILAAPPLMVPVEPHAKEGEPTEGTVELKVAAERDTRNNRTSSEKADLEAAREQLLKSDSVRATGTMSGKKHWKNARSMYLVTQAMRSKTRRAAGAEPTPHAAGGVFQSIGGAQDRSTHAVIPRRYLLPALIKLRSAQLQTLRRTARLSAAWAGCDRFHLIGTIVITPRNKIAAEAYCFHDQHSFHPRVLLAHIPTNSVPVCQQRTAFGPPHSAPVNSLELV